MTDKEITHKLNGLKSGNFAIAEFCASDGKTPYVRVYSTLNDGSPLDEMISFYPQELIDLCRKILEVVE